MRRALEKRRQHEVVEFEHDRIAYVAGAGRYNDGTLARFSSLARSRKRRRDCRARWRGLRLVGPAVRRTLETIRKALTRWPSGEATGVIGHALDLFGATA